MHKRKERECEEDSVGGNKRSRRVDMPPELMARCLSFLSDHDASVAARVCRLWWELTPEGPRRRHPLASSRRGHGYLMWMLDEEGCPTVVALSSAAAAGDLGAFRMIAIRSGISSWDGDMYELAGRSGNEELLEFMESVDAKDRDRACVGAAEAGRVWLLCDLYERIHGNKGTAYHRYLSAMIRSGQVEALEWALDTWIPETFEGEPSPVLLQRVFLTAVRMNSPAAMRAVHSRFDGRSFSDQLWDRAVRGPDRRCLALRCLLLDLEMPCPPPATMGNMARVECADCLRAYGEARPDAFSAEDVRQTMVDGAVSACNLQALEWMVHEGGWSDSQIWVAAARSGNLSVLRWAHESGVHRDEETDRTLTWYVIRDAPPGSTTEVLRWMNALPARSRPMWCCSRERLYDVLTVTVPEAALWAWGRFKTVDRRHRAIIYEACVRTGRVSDLQIMFDEYKPPNIARLWSNAIRGEHMEVLLWMKSIGYLEYDRDVPSAIESASPRTLRWLRSLPEKFRQALGMS